MVRSKTVDLVEHPLSGIVPDMRSDEWDTFLGDIAERGILEPLVVLEDNTVIDGRHRMRAALQLGLSDVPIRVVHLDDGEAEEYMVKAAMLRRHLTDDQRAMLAREWQKRRSRQVQSDAGKYAVGIRDGVIDLPIMGKSITPHNSRQEAADMFGVSKHKLEHIKQLEDEAPEILERVRSGELSIPEARRENRQRERLEEREALVNTRKADIPNNVTLYAGDMLEIMPLLGKFDLVLTDPPYGVTEWEWDKLDTEAWLNAIVPHLSDEYNLFWFCSPKFAADTEIIFREHHIPIQSRIVWHRRNMALGSAAKNKFIDTWEMILHAGTRQLNFPPDWSDAWFDVQIFPVPQTNFTDAKLHPTQKPLGLISRLIEFGSYPGDAIIDPFAGSGTTASVCPTDRYCTLIELRDEYITVIENRLGVSRE